MSEPKKVKLSDDKRAKVKALIDRDSGAKVSKRWRMSDDSLLRAANGYPVQRGTEAQIDIGLSKEEAP